MKLPDAWKNNWLIKAGVKRWPIVMGTPPLAGSPKNRLPWAAGGRVSMSKEAIVSPGSGSRPASPGTVIVLPGAAEVFPFNGTGGWLNSIGSAETIATARLLAPALSVAL